MDLMTQNEDLYRFVQLRHVRGNYIEVNGVACLSVRVEVITGGEAFVALKVDGEVVCCSDARNATDLDLDGTSHFLLTPELKAECLSVNGVSYCPSWQVWPTFHAPFFMNSIQGAKDA